MCNSGIKILCAYITKVSQKHVQSKYIYPRKKYFSTSKMYPKNEDKQPSQTFNDTIPKALRTRLIPRIAEKSYNT